MVQKNALHGDRPILTSVHCYAYVKNALDLLAISRFVFISIAMLTEVKSRLVKLKNAGVI